MDALQHLGKLIDYTAGTWTNSSDSRATAKLFMTPLRDRTRSISQHTCCHHTLSLQKTSQPRQEQYASRSWYEHRRALPRPPDERGGEVALGTKFRFRIDQSEARVLAGNLNGPIRSQDFDHVTQGTGRVSSKRAFYPAGQVSAKRTRSRRQDGGLGV